MGLYNASTIGFFFHSRKSPIPTHPPSPAPSFTRGKKLLSDQRKPLRRCACVVGASGALFRAGAWDGPPQIFRSLRFPLLALTPLRISLLRPVVTITTKAPIVVTIPGRLLQRQLESGKRREVVMLGRCLHHVHHFSRTSYLVA